jgi:hypothetical protein
MANVTLTADIIAAKALDILDNNLVMAKKVYRGHESEFSKKVNGYKVGETITIRKPNQFTVREGATAQIQDVVEGTTTMSVDKQRGVDFQFSSADMTLEIDEFEDRVLKDPMIKLANKVDTELMALYKHIPNWVGPTSGNIDSFADFALAPQRLDEGAVAQNDRTAILSPTDYWAMLGSQTALYMQDAARGAYRSGSLGMIGDVETFMSQNVPTHTNGTRDNSTPFTKTPVSNGVFSTTWAASKDLGYMDLSTDGHDASVTIKAGDVFTIADVYDVNPVTKATLPHLKMFTVVSDVTANGTTTTETTIRISPPIIASGAFQNVSAAPVNDKALSFIGTASANIRQNLVFHKNAFALAVVPMEAPEGAVKVVRKSTKSGLSVRMIPFYDGLNDISNWRLDILFGVKCLDPRLATRLGLAAAGA